MKNKFSNQNYTKTTPEIRFSVNPYTNICATLFIHLIK